jgi:hypothetical protein
MNPKTEWGTGNACAFLWTHAPASLAFAPRKEEQTKNLIVDRDIETEDMIAVLHRTAEYQPRQAHLAHRRPGDG